MSHWYCIGPNGPQRYKQYNKDGGESKRILRGKAMQEGAVESVTTLLKRVQDQSGLIEWSGRLGIDAGIGSVSIEDARARYAEARDRAATAGTEFHDAIEQFLVTGHTSENELHRAAQEEASEWLKSVGSPKIEAERCLIYKGELEGYAVGYGGTTDGIGDILLDWKTTESDSRGKYWTRKAEHCAQLAAYRMAGVQMGLCSASAPCYNVYFDRKTGKIVDSIKWEETALKNGLKLLAVAIRAGVLLDRIEEYV